MLELLAQVSVPRLLLSLGMALAIWTYVTNQQNPNRTDWFRNEIPIETKIPAGLVVVGPAGTVRVKVRASQDAWDRAQTNAFKATVDLSNASAGLHEAPVNVESSPDYTIVDWTPRNVTVRLEPLKTVMVPVKPNLRGNLPPGYQMRQPEITPAEVMASGAESLVDSVTAAAVDINVDNARTTINQNLQPIAQTAKGGEVTGVSFTPPRVQVVLEIEQQNTFKTVPVKVSVTGQVADGYTIGAISVSPEAVTIVGDPAQLEKVDHLETPPVDVNGATSDVNRSLAPLILPQGVTLQTPGQQVAVKIQVSVLRGTATTRVALSVLGVPPTLQPGNLPSFVQVVVAGPAPTLQDLKPTDFTATIDLSGRGPGTYTVPVRVAAPDSVSITRITPTAVTVTLAAPTPAP